MFQASVGWALVAHPPLAIEQLKRKTGKMNYVVLENGQLIIGRQRNTEVGGGHIDLAKGKPVLAAGEVKFVNGKIHYIDNTSASVGWVLAPTRFINMQQNHNFNVQY